MGPTLTSSEPMFGASGREGNGNVCPGGWGLGGLESESLPANTKMKQRTLTKFFLAVEPFIQRNLTTI